jgi:hypothetical protein
VCYPGVISAMTRSSGDAGVRNRRSTSRRRGGLGPGTGAGRDVLESRLYGRVKEVAGQRPCSAPPTTPTPRRRAPSKSPTGSPATPAPAHSSGASPAVVCDQLKSGVPGPTAPGFTPSGARPGSLWSCSIWSTWSSIPTATATPGSAIPGRERLEWVRPQATYPPDYKGSTRIDEEPESCSLWSQILQEAF